MPGSLWTHRLRGRQPEPIKEPRAARPVGYHRSPVLTWCQSFALWQNSIRHTLPFKLGGCIRCNGSSGGRNGRGRNRSNVSRSRGGVTGDGTRRRDLDLLLRSRGDSDLVLDLCRLLRLLGDLSLDVRRRLLDLLLRAAVRCSTCRVNVSTWLLSDELDSATGVEVATAMGIRVSGATAGIGPRALMALAQVRSA